MRGKAGSKAAYDLADPALKELIDPDLYEQLQEEVELLEVGAQLIWRGGAAVHVVQMQLLLGTCFT